MRTGRELVTAAVVFCGLVAAAKAEVRAIAVTGIVRMAQPGNDVGQNVTKGLVVPVGSEVRTTETGSVTLQFGVGNTVRLKENSRLLVSEPKPKETRVQFLAGRMKGVFARLTGGEKFSIQFASGAVCSVKGTTITCQDVPGGTQLATLYGVADLDANGHSTLVPQGCGATMNGAGNFKVDTLDDQQIEAGLADWNAEGVGKAREAARDEARAVLKDVVSDLRDQTQQAQELVTQTKENDFSAGRTLRDMHGNLTRVDQRLLRPEGDHIQFINLVKRDAYAYNGHFAYAGSAGARLDYLQNDLYLGYADGSAVNMPESLTDWPTFFLDARNNHQDIQPTRTVMTLANGGAGSDRDVIKFDVSFHQVTTTNSWQEPVTTWTNVYDASCQCTRSVQQTTYVTHTSTNTSWRPIETLPTLNGKYFLSDDAINKNDGLKAYRGGGMPVSDGGDGSGQLHAFAVGAFQYAKLNPDGSLATDANGNFYADPSQPTPFYMNIEGAVINNSGAIRNLSDFQSNAINPLQILNIAYTNAAEAIVSVTDQPGGGNQLLGHNAGNHSNIDVVVTPDIVVTAAQKILTEGNIPLDQIK